MFQAKQKQAKRKKYYEHTNIRHDGKLKDSHLGCGCPHCKPWKHKLTSKYKPGELKQLLDKIDKDNLNIDKDWVK